MSERERWRRWGIEPGYEDHRGRWHGTSPATARALLEAMGAGDDPAPPGADEPAPVLVVAAGQGAPLEGRWELRSEDGGEQPVEGAVPADLPPGYHRLRREADGRVARLVVTPGACFLPEGQRAWGWAAQLYAARSRHSWGMGDLADLRRLARWAAGQGAGMVLVNPLHAVLPTDAQQPSPYTPSSRCFHNPLYLRVEEVPGAAALGEELEALAAAGRALNADRRIDRDAVWRLKRSALERLWETAAAGGAGSAEAAGGSAGSTADGAPFSRWCEEQGPALAGYATFCALAEEHGLPWSAWPAGLRDPDGPEVLAFVDRHRRRIRFHQWVQWLLDRQLAEAGAELPVVQDLAVGVDPSGADAWFWHDCFALDVRVGAPPDEFASRGQDWGLPPFDPWRLRAAAYQPFVQTLRAMFRHAGGVRIDHVMGLFRLFWVPPGAGPAEGAYVRYPWRDLLGILALESQRAGAYVVGEDLGTVEPFVREELARRRVLSYRLVWFEPVPPRQFPAQALAAVTTHDLPTVAGLWSGFDLAEQERLGREPNVEGTRAIRRRLREWTGVADDAPVEEVVRRTHEALAEAPSAVVTATLDDALAVEERPNLPGTVDKRPNWSLALPVPLEELEDHPGPASVAAALARHRPLPPAPPPSAGSRE